MLSNNAFSLPGEAGFPLNQLYQAAGGETEQLRAYISQLRTETVNRLLDRIYVDGVLSKWWICFAKKKFMNKQL